MTSRLLEANETAAVFYRDQLLRSPGPSSYLRSRGFDALLGQTRWTVGYAPAGWTALTSHLRAAGHTDQELLDAGLALHTRRGTLIDRFRDRITFGIRDNNGDLLGFTGRAAPHAKPHCPKYLNTPRTATYDKGRLLFGLGELNDGQRRAGRIIVTEGPLDAIAVDLGGHGPALSACGTALTRDHARHLEAETIIVAFDLDRAGRAAASRAYTCLQSSHATLLCLRGVDDTDPADWFAAGGPQRLAARISDCVPLADRVLDHALDGWRDIPDNVEAAIAAARQSVRAIATMRNDDVARQVTRVAEATGLPHFLITAELQAEVERRTIHQTPDPRHVRSRAMQARCQEG